MSSEPINFNLTFKYKKLKKVVMSNIKNASIVLFFFYSKNKVKKSLKVQTWSEF